MKRIFFIFVFTFLILIQFKNFSQAQTTKNAENSIPDLNQLAILNLKTAGKIALAKNPSLSAAYARVQQAKQRLTQARSTYWPRLDATASYARTDISNNAYQTNLATARLFNPAATMENPDNYYNAGIRATWVLFDGFEREYLNAVARYGKEQTEFARDDVKRLLLSSVAETYFTAQLAAENIKISLADEEFNNRLLEEAKARTRIGAGSLSDELNFEIRVNTAKAQRLNEENTYQTTMYGLAAILGIPEVAFPKHIVLTTLEPETQDEVATLDTEQLIEFSLTNRVDLLGNNSALMASESEVAKARASFYPSVNLSAAVDGSRAGDSSFEGDDFQNSVGISVYYNLFSGGSDRAKLRETKEKKFEAMRNLESSKLAVISEVRQAVENIRLAQKEHTLQRSNAILVKKNRDLVEKEYAAGQGSLVRLNEAQRDLIAAKSRLTLALVSLRMTKLKLETATGSILERFEE